jgi:hypothetical protein
MAPWLLAQLAKLDKDLRRRVNRKNIALISGAQSGAVEVLVGLAMLVSLFIAIPGPCLPLSFWIS